MTLGPWCWWCSAEPNRSPHPNSVGNAWPLRTRFRVFGRFLGRESRSAHDATPFAGRSAFVVDMGNTGDEIAPDLCEAGVPFAPSLRSPVIDVGALARIRAGAADALLTE